jgi:hypothetical protein
MADPVDPRQQSGPDPKIVKFAQANGMTYPQAQEAMASFGYAGQQNSNDPPLYWNTTRNAGYINKDVEQGGRVYVQPSKTDVTRSASEASFWFQEGIFSQSPAALKIRQEMVDAGLIPPDADPTKAMEAWNGLVQLSVDAYAHNRNVSPFQYLDMWKASAQNAANTPTTWVSHETTTTRRNPKDLQAAYQNVAQDALGRRATGSEAASAAGVVGAQAAANPETSTTTSTENSRTHQRTSHTVSNAGMGADAINEALLHQAMQNPEYGAYQAAGHYFPLLVNALSAINQAGT